MMAAIKPLALDKILNIAHRGARAYAPENTLPAFEKAVQMGCDMFELDVRLSKDGELMVFHDEDLLRCTDAIHKFPGRYNYQLAEFTVAELAELDAGSWYVHELALNPADRQSYLQSLSQHELNQFVLANELDLYRSGQVKIPTLKQALELAKANQLTVNVELKGLADPEQAIRMTEAAILLIEALEMTEHVLISSFEQDLLNQVRLLTKTIATGLLTGDKLADPVAYLQALDAEAYHPDGNLFNDGSSDFMALRRQGMAVNVWTCNQPEQISNMIKLGATGIISDYPNRVSDCTAAAQAQN
jgi:glycerophosphoryl diester phosphodiesterase